MPIYEYRCGACGQEHEALQKVSEPPLKVCPACGKPKLKKLLSAAGFQLKGSGWYATDFKSKAPAKKPEAKSETKTETKTETKPKPTPAATD
jgi:putative FmdB family regulatory protein